MTQLYIFSGTIPSQVTTAPYKYVHGSLCVTYCLFIPAAAFCIQVSAGAGLRLPCSGRGGIQSMSITDPALSPVLPGNPLSLTHSPGTFPVAYKILPPVFKCPLHTFPSKLHIIWDSVSCSLCSSEDRLDVPVGCMSRWAQHLPTSPPSSSSHQSCLCIANF